MAEDHYDSEKDSRKRGLVSSKERMSSHPSDEKYNPVGGENKYQAMEYETDDDEMSWSSR